MKKITSLAISVMAMALLSACGNRQKPTVESITPEWQLTTLTETDTMSLGEHGTLIMLRDNADDKMNPPSLFADAPDSLIAQMELSEGIPASISAFILQTDGKTILFDAGLGPKMGGGNMLVQMEAHGISPADVDVICLTHLHGDHIGGLMGESGPAFPNAEVYLGQVEHDAWMAMPDDKNGLQKAVIGMYAEHLHLFAFDQELPCGVLPLNAVGHTPGHTVFRWQQLLIIGDLLHGYALQSLHPEYCSNYDMDKEQSVESRKRIYQYASDNQLTMVGMHMPAASSATYHKQ